MTVPEIFEAYLTNPPYDSYTVDQEMLCISNDVGINFHDGGTCAASAQRPELKITVFNGSLSDFTVDAVMGAPEDVRPARDAHGHIPGWKLYGLEIEANTDGAFANAFLSLHYLRDDPAIFDQPIHDERGLVKPEWAARNLADPMYTGYELGLLIECDDVAYILNYYECEQVAACEIVEIVGGVKNRRFLRWFLSSEMQERGHWQVQQLIGDEEARRICATADIAGSADKIDAAAAEQAEAVH